MASDDPARPSIAPPPGTLRLAIDRNALKANWRALDALSGHASTGAAVKADGYGLGARRVVTALAEVGCRDFFVAHWHEAAALLGLVDPSRIAVLHGPLTAEDAAFAIATGLRPVINSISQARRWTDAGGGACDLMVDTGMNRLGVSPNELGDTAISALDIDALHSHLACAEESSSLRNVAQQKLFTAARTSVRHRRASLANSAGIMLGPSYHADLTRPGLALYGGVPCGALAPHVEQVARPQAALIQVRELNAGDSVGYGGTFTAPCAMRVGTVSIGYADGYLRHWSGRGAMLHNGHALPVLGRISMDMTIIDLSGTRELHEGDWVEIYYALPAAAQRTGLSQYELLTVLNRRFAR